MLFRLKYLRLTLAHCDEATDTVVNFSIANIINGAKYDILLSIKSYIWPILKLRSRSCTFRVRIPCKWRQMGGNRHHDQLWPIDKVVKDIYALACLWS